MLYPRASRATSIDPSWERIGVTGNHPIWSEDRHDYVAAMDLRLGERLKNLSGDTVWVQQKLPRPGPTPVYNLEVQDEHVYYVGASGVLAHNVGKKQVGKGKNAECEAESAKDAAIRDMNYEDAFLSDHDTQFYKSSGNYSLYFESGKRYHGKGLEPRMNDSIRRLGSQNGDSVIRKNFAFSYNEVDAFVEEARRIDADGGIDGGRLYNKINSPGRKRRGRK